MGGANGGTATYFAAAFSGHKGVLRRAERVGLLPFLKKVESEHPTVIVRRLALGNRTGEATLHVTANDLSSSLNEI